VDIRVALSWRFSWFRGFEVGGCRAGRSELLRWRRLIDHVLDKGRMCVEVANRRCAVDLFWTRWEVRRGCAYVE